MRTIPFMECVDVVGSACKPFSGTKKYVSTGAVAVDHINEANIEIIDYKGKPSRANLEVMPGNVIFAKMQGTKKTLMINSELSNNIYSTGFCAVQAKEGILTKRCLYHLLTSETFLSQKDKNCSGATQKAITNAGLEKILIRVPDVKTQGLIADRLDVISRIIAKRQKELAALDDLIKARFVEMFGCERDYVLKAKHRVVDICEARVGIVIQPTQYYTDDIENGVKAFRSLNVKPFRVNEEDWVMFSKDSNDSLRRTQVHTNDVAVVRSGANLGDSCIIPAQYDGCNAIDILLLTCNSEVLPIYLSAFINYPVGKSQILNVQRGGAIKHLNLKQLEQSKIFVPSMEEQKEFAAFIAQIDKSKFAVQKSLEETQKLFNSLMQQYFG